MVEATGLPVASWSALIFYRKDPLEIAISDTYTKDGNSRYEGHNAEHSAVAPLLGLGPIVWILWISWAFKVDNFRLGLRTFLAMINGILIFTWRRLLLEVLRVLSCISLRWRTMGRR